MTPWRDPPPSLSLFCFCVFVIVKVTLSQEIYPTPGKPQNPMVDFVIDNTTVDYVYDEVPPPYIPPFPLWSIVLLGSPDPGQRL